jgi:hypothetical protein
VATAGALFSIAFSWSLSASSTEQLLTVSFITDSGTNMYKHFVMVVLAALMAACECKTSGGCFWTQATAVTSTQACFVAKVTAEKAGCVSPTLDANNECTYAVTIPAAVVESRDAGNVDVLVQPGQRVAVAVARQASKLGSNGGQAYTINATGAGGQSVTLNFETTAACQ